MLFYYKKTILIIVLLCITLIQCKKEIPVDSIPSIVDLGESQVTISWKSNIPYVGKISYKAAGTSENISVVTDKLGETKNHEVEISGLKPSTQYLYWIEGMEKQYHFKTKPVQNTPFSFIITSGEEKTNYLSILKAEGSSFIITLRDSTNEALSGCTPYTPIFTSPKPDWEINWGGLHLTIIRRDNDLSRGLKAPGSHISGVVAYPTIFGRFPGIKSSLLHKTLTEHNKQASETPVSFVCILNSNMDFMRLDGISYIGLAQGKNEADLHNFTASINVGLESTSIYFINTGEEFMLKEPPLQGKRTCRECRRLAEKGAYEESIRAYKHFIKDHKGHYQVDDAYFAIAELYDEKLFDYTQALEWYTLLIRDFPLSNLVPLANQRINYISSYDDIDYKPLAAFEKIKTYEFANANNSVEKQALVLEKLNKIINQYPDANITPTMLLWMANQYQLIDLEKAIAAYHGLLGLYPDFSKKNEALLKMGETYYNNEKWHEAYKIYVKASNEFPGLKETIDSQLFRIKRNIRRIQLKNFSVIFLIIILITVFLIHPRGLKYPRRKTLINGFMIYVIILLLYSWIYREEFSSVKEMLLLTIAILISLFLGILSAYSFTRKLPFKHRFISVVTGDIIGFITFACGFYLGIYYIYVHYLIVAGL